MFEKDFNDYMYQFRVEFAEENNIDLLKKELEIVILDKIATQEKAEFEMDREKYDTLMSRQDVILARQYAIEEKIEEIEGL